MIYCIQSMIWIQLMRTSMVQQSWAFLYSSTIPLCCSEILLTLNVGRSMHVCMLTYWKSYTGSDWLSLVRLYGSPEAGHCNSRNSKMFCYCKKYVYVLLGLLAHFLRANTTSPCYLIPCICFAHRVKTF